MNVEELKSLAARLADGPVPTSEKKLYACLGAFSVLQPIIPAGVLIDSSILDAFDANGIPESEEALRELIPQRLSARLAELQRRRSTSITILRDAAILCRYQVGLTFLYNLVGDGHAILLNQSWPEGAMPNPFPPYVRFDPKEVIRFFERSLGPNCFSL